MSNNERSGCINCAYMEKSKGKMWCKFHDFPVNTRNVCDDFFDSADEPLSIGLYEDIADNSASDPRSKNTGKDITLTIWMTFILIFPWLEAFLVYMGFVC